MPHTQVLLEVNQWMNSIARTDFGNLKYSTTKEFSSRPFMELYLTMVRYFT